MRYAQIINGVAVNIIESAQPPGGNWVLCTTQGIGWLFDGTTWTEPTQSTPEYKWFIDPGSFRDRFGAAKTAVLTSTDAGIRALLEDMQGRPWIDLQRADVAGGLAYIGSVVGAVTPSLQTQILTTEPTAFEQLVLRKLYFS